VCKFGVRVLLPLPLNVLAYWTIHFPTYNTRVSVNLEVLYYSINYVVEIQETTNNGCACFPISYLTALDVALFQTQIYCSKANCTTMYITLNRVTNYISLYIINNVHHTDKLCNKFETYLYFVYISSSFMISYSMKMYKVQYKLHVKYVLYLTDTKPKLNLPSNV
jgi:hypothetical protein